MGRQALLVIDMLHDFLDPGGSLYCGDQAREIIPKVRDLIEAHRRAGSAIIFLTDWHAPDDKEFRMFPPHAVAGEHGAEIIPELEVKDGDHVIRKTRFSAFYGSDLGRVLESEGVEEIHMSGVCTSICVMDTTSDARNRDYPVVIHTRAVADFDQEAHEFSLKRMEKVLGARLED